jgi:hypothetical protein
MIETVDGLTVYCDMESENLARELGERLYTWVSLKGKAKWDTQSLQLEDFKIAEVAEYGRISITRAFSELSSIAGQYYTNITDVEGYIASLRSQEGEE